MYVELRKENALRKFPFKKKNKFEAHRCQSACVSGAGFRRSRRDIGDRGPHERMRHATRIVFSHLISAACRCRSLRSQVLGLLFARQKVATAETARRCMYVAARAYVCVYTYSTYTPSSSSQSCGSNAACKLSTRLLETALARPHLAA